ncbi:kinase-like domain-containing protein [Daedaleopsis nitida]|nr:kinase-like domain-containing protein [Daedaleopsis nitida]
MTTSSTGSPPLAPSEVHIVSSKPPAWALVDLRNDRQSKPDRQVPTAATAPTSVIPHPGSPSSLSKSASMSSPEDFTFLKELGCGSWSTVMEAIHVGTSKRYAVKILSKSQLIKQKKVKYASVEKDALVKLSSTHPGIVKMYAAFQDDTSLYFVLDLALHGDLADLVKKHGSLSLRCARWYAAQIVDAVLWIHGKGIVHRDVKPENMLLDSELRIKLTDFGSAYIAPDGNLSPRSSTFVGSAAYVSPELLDRTSKTTSNSSDIWAIGCTLFFLIAGTPPFIAINDYQSFRKIEALDYTFPDNFYENAKDLIQHLLVLDPSDRLGVEPKSSPSQLRDHSFFAGASAEHAGHDADMPPIRWDSLWTESPVPPETGIVQPRPSSIADNNDEDSLWENVVHEFSLVHIRSPSGASSAPVDVSPGAVPCEVVGTVLPDQQVNGAAIAPADEGEDGDDVTLKTKDWFVVSHTPQ